MDVGQQITIVLILVVSFVLGLIVGFSGHKKYGHRTELGFMVSGLMLCSLGLVLSYPFYSERFLDVIVFKVSGSHPRIYAVGCLLLLTGIVASGVNFLQDIIRYVIRHRDGE